MLQAVFVVVSLAALVYVGGSVAIRYREATGSTWDKLKATVRGSLTVLWSKVLIVLTAGFGFVAEAAGVLNDPELKAQLMSIINPEYVPFIGLFVAVVTLLVRLRSAPP